MYSTALKRGVISTLIYLVSCASFASDTPPSILKDPVLGLRYDISKTKFEPLAKTEASKCQTNENRTSVMFVYGKYTDNSSRTYYVLGGYDVWKYPDKPQEKFEADEYGAVFYIQGDKCIHLDEARQTFIDRVFNDEMSPQVLQALATDAATRLVRAFGGADRLKVELRNQRVDMTDLPVELRAAFKPYGILPR